MWYKGSEIWNRGNVHVCAEGKRQKGKIADRGSNIYYHWLLLLLIYICHWLLLLLMYICKHPESKIFSAAVRIGHSEDAVKTRAETR